jgi:hypothetical protein
MMIIRGAILAASLAGTAAFSGSVAANCPEYVFQPQATYAPGACDIQSGYPARATSPAVAGCASQQVSIPQPVCEQSDFRRQGEKNTLNVKITQLREPEGHSLGNKLTSAGFHPINQVTQATLRDQGMFDPSIVNEDTDIILDIETDDLTATYGWSGLPGEELAVDGKVSSLKFGCNAYGPYEVFMVACASDEVWCLVGLADRYDSEGSRRLLSVPDESRSLLSRVAGHLASPGSLFGMAAGVALEGSRHLLSSHNCIGKCDQY